MLLRILKSNQAYNLILFPIIAILLWFMSLISPSSYSFYPGEDEMVLFKPIYSLVREYPFLQALIALVLIILIGFMVQSLNNKFSFIRIRSLLPSSYFIILASSVTQLHTLHPVMFAALFMMLALTQLFDVYEKNNFFSNAFDVGILLGIGSLFYLNLFFLFPAFILGMITINREFSWRELVLIFLGVVLPWFFSYSYFLFFEDPGELLELLKTNVLTKNSQIEGNLPLQLFFGFQILLTIIASLNIIKFYDRKKVSSRKYFTAHFWIFLFSALSVFVIPAVSKEILILISIPVTYLICNFLVFSKSKLLGEVIFAIFIGLAIYLQFV